MTYTNPHSTSVPLKLLTTIFKICISINTALMILSPEGKILPQVDHAVTLNSIRGFTLIEMDETIYLSRQKTFSETKNISQI